MWYLAKVTRVWPHLGCGFEIDQTVYVTRDSREDGVWIVFNGAYGDRYLSTAELQGCVQSIKLDKGVAIASDQRKVDQLWQRCLHPR